MQQDIAAILKQTHIVQTKWVQIEKLRSLAPCMMYTKTTSQHDSRKWVNVLYCVVGGLYVVGGLGTSVSFLTTGNGGELLASVVLLGIGIYLLVEFVRRKRRWRP